MKKMIAALLAVGIVAGFTSCSSAPVNGVAALKRKEDSTTGWFALKGDELIETLNEKGRQAGYPELQILETFEEPAIAPEDHGYGVSKESNLQIYIDCFGEKEPEYAEYEDCIYSIEIYTDIDMEDGAEAVGFYLDEIVGIFSPKNKDKIEKELGMFAAVKGYKELIDGNVLYKRSDDEVWIYANPDAAEAITLGDKTPPPHLKKPE